MSFDKLGIILAVLVLFVTGCTSDIGPVARKVGVNSIQIKPHVGVDQPMRIGFKSDTGNLSVAAAGIIVNKMYSKHLSQLSSKMQQNEIDVTEMVRRGAINMLREQKGFTIATNDADAALVVAIMQYGFDDAGLSLSREVPFIVLRAELIRHGERIWKGKGEAHPFRSGGLGARSEEYLAQPELLRKHWEAQVNRALRKLLTAESAE